MNDTAKRPVVFVGSSTEGLPVAKAIQVALDPASEVTLWSQGVFGLSQGTLEALVSAAQRFDFAVLVLTPDDLVESRGVAASSARDNVLFELGLFMGILGRRRTFTVYDRTAKLRLPSDLAGVTCATYAPYDSDLPGGLRASLGAACTQIEEAMTSEGPRVKPTDVAALEDAIQRLQGELRGRRPEMNPVLVEGGPLPGTENASGESVLIDSFLIDAFPVTNLEFQQFVAANQDWSRETIYRNYGIPYYLCQFRYDVAPEDKWDHPVVWVNWYIAAAYCNWRSAVDGRVPVYTIRSPRDVGAGFSADGWRLPTECEWEMAARAGSAGADQWNGAVTPRQANFGQCYRDTTSVGRFDPNPLGIFDMLGNVKHWCHDWYSGNEAAPPAINPSGPDTGKFKSYRGASFMDKKELLRFSERGKLPPENTNPDFGFRCVRRSRRFGS